AARECCADPLAGADLRDLRRELFGYAHLLKEGREVEAARPGREYDRLCGQQAGLERRGRRDVGSRYAGTRRDTDSRLVEIDAAHERALLDEVIDAGSRNNDDIGHLAPSNPLDDVDGAAPVDGDFVPGLLLERRNELAIGLPDGVRGYHLYLCGPGCGRQEGR